MVSTTQCSQRVCGGDGDTKLLVFTHPYVQRFKNSKRRIFSRKGEGRVYKHWEKYKEAEKERRRKRPPTPPCPAHTAHLGITYNRIILEGQKAQHIVFTCTLL